MENAGKGICRGQQGHSLAAAMYNQLQQGKIMIDCLLYPSSNKCRIVRSPSQRLTDIAVDLERALAVPAKVSFMSNMDGSIKRAGVLSLTEPLRAFGLKGYDCITVEVHLSRKATQCREELQGVGEQRPRKAGEDDEIKEGHHGARNELSAASGSMIKEDETAAKKDKDKSGNHSAPSVAARLDKVTDCYTERTSSTNTKQSCFGECGFHKAVKGFQNAEFEAVRRWQAFSTSNSSQVVNRRSSSHLV